MIHTSRRRALDRGLSVFGSQRSKGEPDQHGQRQDDPDGAGGVERFLPGGPRPVRPALTQPPTEQKDPPPEQVLRLLEAQRVFEIVTELPGC